MRQDPGRTAQDNTGRKQARDTGTGYAGLKAQGIQMKRRKDHWGTQGGSTRVMEAIQKSTVNTEWYTEEHRGFSYKRLDILLFKTEPPLVLARSCQPQKDKPSTRAWNRRMWQSVVVQVRPLKTDTFTPSRLQKKKKTLTRSARPQNKRVQMY